MPVGGFGFGSATSTPAGSPAVAPTVTTQAVSGIGLTTATGNGTVVSDGGSAITQRGVCWNTTGSPTTSDSTATAAGTTGAFTASIVSLTSGTLYHVRAYAINAIGTSYGSDVTFTSASGTLFANVDFETAGTFAQTISPLTGVGSIVTSPVFSGTHALAEVGNSTNYVTYQFANNAALIAHNPNGIWVVWQQAYDATALANAFSTGGGQFKTFLSRYLDNGSGQPGGPMIGHGTPSSVRAGACNTRS